MVVERRKQIAVEEKEIERKEKELTATVKRPAEAESYKVQTLAKGQRYVLIRLLRLKASSINNFTSYPV